MKASGWAKGRWEHAVPSPSSCSVAAQGLIWTSSGFLAKLSITLFQPRPLIGTRTKRPVSIPTAPGQDAQTTHLFHPQRRVQASWDSWKYRNFPGFLGMGLPSHPPNWRGSKVMLPAGHVDWCVEYAAAARIQAFGASPDSSQWWHPLTRSRKHCKRKLLVPAITNAISHTSHRPLPGFPRT